MSSMLLSLNCCRQIKSQEENHCKIEKITDNNLRSRKSRHQSRRSVQKILLLGTGESGKSTFLKQMRIITGKSFSNEELQFFKCIIYDNIYKGTLFLIQAKFDIMLRRRNTMI
ncbi:unnamed protein product [Rodentolepis nana]|uniref:G-protein alpha subunit n=1 Tax=Rodentolepis nana TaxID=102285 RepID=A0A0R3T538_RODNA|nr:unnamed protein product [Rodentolepis nana]